MCIRDRDELNLPLMVESNSALHGTQFTVTVDAIEGTTTGTVSYTHLRAHETVLDLVCRLLLEKKNNAKTKTID